MAAEAKVTVFPRLEIRDLAKNKAQFSLFVRAFTALQAVDVNNIHSFQKIGAIHGDPTNEVWDPATDTTPRTEQDIFCQHGTPFFPPWHRVYMMYIENAIRDHAAQIAKKLNKPIFNAAVESLRFPYWDWAHVSGKLPDELTSKNIVILGDDGVGTTSVRNPLYSYVLLKGFKSVDDDGSPSPFDTTKPGVPTVRSPAFLPKNSVNDLSNFYHSSADLAYIRAYLVRILTRNADTWDLFSNQGSVKENLESIHGILHVHIGGASYVTGKSTGWMSVVHLAAYDPIFYFHHCQVDRLTALWQAAHQGQAKNYLTSGEVKDTDAFKPFTVKNSRISDYSQVRETRPLGYYYPDLANQAITNAEAKQLIKSLYSDVDHTLASHSMLMFTARAGPASGLASDEITEVTPLLKLQVQVKSGLGKGGLLLALTYVPEENKETLVSVIPVFARAFDPDAVCITCVENPTKFVDLPLNKGLEALNIHVKNPYDRSSWQEAGLISIHAQKPKLKLQIFHIGASDKAESAADIVVGDPRIVVSDPRDGEDLATFLVKVVFATAENSYRPGPAAA